MSQNLKDCFYFTRSERIAIIALSCFIMGFIFLQYLPSSTNEEINFLSLEDRITDLDEPFKKKQEVKNKAFESIQKTKPKKLKSRIAPLTRKKEKFSFDPNLISKDSLVRLGFKSSTASTWVKFRKKGKKFHEYSDLESIYGVNTELLNELKEYINYPSEPFPIVNKESFNKEWIEKPIMLGAPIDLNDCDVNDLKKLGGIGQVYSSRILKFRDLLGGFTDKDQLLSVYGMTDSLYQIIKEHVTIEKKPNLVKINTLNRKELAKHYYVNFKTAKLIIAYREEHGPFVDSADFSPIIGVPQELKEKILPYLDFAL